MTSMMKSLAVAAAALVCTTAALATPVTAGHMSREAGSEVIQDSLNDRQWLGADVTKGLTYAQTVAATAAGGSFAGYTIAGEADALMFQAALFGAAQGCEDTGWGYTTCQRSDSGNASRTVFGESYYDYAQWGDDYDYSYMWFQAAPSYGANAVGYVELYSSASSMQLGVLKSWATISDADFWAGQSDASIGWLLYRNGNPQNLVTEPGSLALAGLAIVGVALTRRRRALVGS